MQALPIGIQTFSSIREGDYVYIDKTELIWEMAQRQGRYFLSRPRRFGKSLLVDTLKELFEGNQSLFEGLYIADRWNWSQTYPVIKLDFSGNVIHDLKSLVGCFDYLLAMNQESLSVNIDKQHADATTQLALLIKRTYQHYKQKVVVLIDEYDKPILDNIDNADVVSDLREHLKGFYSVLKEQDPYIQFIFMTGVSKFSKVSLFSGLNQLNDITLDARYATLCGYTQNDLQTRFTEHLQGVDWAELKDWYNGYQFLGEPVYNPYDVLLFIDRGQMYRNYWFETGSPGFLLKLFRKERYFLPNLEAIEVGEEILDSFDVENINPITLLFQAGYLTIDNVYPSIMGDPVYCLRIPNREVKMALHTHFLQGYSHLSESLIKRRSQLAQALIDADFNAIETTIKALFSAIPWHNYKKNDIHTAEGFYASVLYAWLSSLNAGIIPEDVSSHGQVDLTVTLAGQIYVIEIKVDHSEDYQPQTTNAALEQIINRGYADKYQDQPKVYELGLVFNSHARNLVQINWQSR